MTKSNEYVFFKLGRNKELAEVEISTILEKVGINRKISYFQWKEFLFVKIEKKKNRRFFKKLEKLEV